MSKQLSGNYHPALEEKSLPSDIFEIVDYNRTDYSYGCTVISYHEYMRSKTHLKYFGLFLPFTLLVDGVIRVLQEKRIHYFHTEDGVHLGNTESEAVEHANEIGEQKMELKEYEKARSYFDIAFKLSRKMIFKEKREKAENGTKKQTEERIRKEREVIEEEARKCFEQSQHLWNEAFYLESSNNISEAEGKFHICLNLFSKAAELMPNNAQYSHWRQAANLKLDGDILFNDGMILQKQGSQLCETRKYDEALNKFEEALQKYTEGFNRSGDSRFEDCMKIVKDCKNRVEIITMKTKLNRMQIFNSNHGQKCSSQLLHRNLTFIKMVDS